MARKRKKQAGRDSKLTPAVQKIMTDAIEVGAYKETACTLAGITFQTVQNWLERGRKEKSGPYFEFFEALTRAEAKNELDRLQEWRAFMKDEFGVVEEYDKDGKLVKSKEKIVRYGDYRAVRDFLERRYRARWGQKVEVGGPDGGPIITEIRRIIVRT